MSKANELRRVPEAGARPALPSASTTTTSATAAASQPPKARPPSASTSAHKGPPPNAVLIKVAKTLMSAPPANGSTASSPAGAAKQSVPVASPVAVPEHSWYANPFQLTTNTPMTEFHRAMRGKVFFSPRAVPVTASELLSLPGERPPQLTVCELGKDLLYGVAYLYNTPLAVEHQWRGRVAHLLRVRSSQAPIPKVVRRRAETVAALQQKQHDARRGPGAAGAGAGTRRPAKEASVPAFPSSSSSSEVPSSPAPPIDYRSTMTYEHGEAAVYERPGNDLLIGVKLYVDDELVEDHYPIRNALPQCTATLPVTEAAQHWNCVPFVLMGYLNQQMLDPISVYHSLSLSFVEHLLRVKLPESAAPAKGSTASPVTAAPTRKDATPALTKKSAAPPLELTLRVEVVYGCRAEAYYCTDFICRGACTLRMTESSKKALKAYEEKLRALARLRLAAPQLISRGSGSSSSSSGGEGNLPPPRNCHLCGHPLQYRCTVCGADVCGMPTCATSTVVGYPRACTRHALPSDSQ